MSLGWYKSRSDGLWSLEIGPAANLLLEVVWPSRFTGVASVTPQTPVAEGGSVAVSVESFDDSGMIFRVQGSGGRVAFRVAFNGGQIEDVTLRFKLIET